MSDYDVTGFTDTELIDVYHHIDTDTYPDRFECIVAEMEKRQLFIKESSDGAVIPKNRYDLEPKTPEDNKKMLKFRMQIGVLWGLGILVFSLSCVYQRLAISVNGIVVEREVKCSERGNRCVTHYTIMNDNGETSIYKAPPNDTALSRNIPVGARIKKDYGRLNYTVDSVIQKDFHIIIYSFQLMIGLMLIGQGIDAFMEYRKT